MNIFILDNDLATSAAMHPDKLCVKMILEAAQLACTALRTRGLETPYKATHVNHPCAKFTRRNDASFLYTVDYGLALAAEYTHRFDKHHKTTDVLHLCRESFTPGMFGDGYVFFAQAMPEHFKSFDAVDSYRRYINSTKDYRFKFTNREVPTWIC